MNCPPSPLPQKATKQKLGTCNSAILTLIFHALQKPPASKEETTSTSSLGTSCSEQQKKLQLLEVFAHPEKPLCRSYHRTGTALLHQDLSCNCSLLEAHPVVFSSSKMRWKRKKNLAGGLKICLREHAPRKVCKYMSILEVCIQLARSLRGVVRNVLRPNSKKKNPEK